MYQSSPTTNNCLDPSLFNLEIPILENGKPTLLLGDIWIPGSLKTEQHYVKFLQGWRVCL